MTKDEIIKELADIENQEAVESFASYCIRTKLAKKKDGTLQNPFMQKKTAKEMATLYRRVAKDGLVFDGVHITLQSTGISYDYVAYKNKMFLAYPESVVDLGLVYEGDTFEFKKASGKVMYTHDIANPFGSKTDSIIGGYCVIKNKRGEFLTTLSREEIDKHRKVAKTDFIWKQWYSEMSMKTIIKKACKMHFADVYEDIEKNDNDNYDLDNPLELAQEHKTAIDEIDTVEELQEYYQAHKGAGKEFDAYVTKRKNEIA